MNGIRGGSVPDRGEGQHTDGVRLRRHQALDGGDDAVLHVVDLPHAHGLVLVHGVVHAVALDLAVGLLRLLPAHHHGVGGEDPGVDVSRRAGGRLLGGPGLHSAAGRPLSNAVEGGHAELVLGVGVETADAVARGGDAVHRLKLAVGTLGAVLDDVIGDRVRVPRVPGDGDAGGGCLGNNGHPWSLRQSWKGMSRTEQLTVRGEV